MSEISSQKEITSTDESSSKSKITFCSKCNKNFSTLGNLRNHIMTIHENKRPFKCHYPNCNKSYSIESRLQVHYRIHVRYYYYYYRPEQSHSFAKNVERLSMKKEISKLIKDFILSNDRLNAQIVLRHIKLTGI